MEKFKREDFYPFKNIHDLNKIIDLIKPFILEYKIDVNFNIEDISDIILPDITLDQSDYFLSDY